VSKILSLNHEGRVNRGGREAIQEPSRFVSPPFPWVCTHRVWRYYIVFRL
jgi:hypothetical protein